MSSWLIRTAQNQIHRPCSADEVRRLILEGHLKLQDEVCPAGGYWFYLHEAEELKAQLGIEVPRARKTRGAGEEITETSTETQPDLDLTDPELRANAPPLPAPAQHNSEPDAGFERNPDRSHVFEKSDYAVESRGIGIEPQPVLWTVVLFTVAAAILVLYWVWRLIQT